MARQGGNGSGSGRTKARIVDALLAACFVAVMATALVAEAPHEFLGLGLFALVIARVVLNRRWFAALAKGRYTDVRVLRLVSAAGLVVCIVSQAASALALSKHALVFLPALPGAAWARQVHMLCSHWPFMFVFAHAGLQLKGVLARIRRGVQPKPAARWAVRIAVASVAVFGAVSIVQLGLPAYLTAQVQFAAGDPNVPLAFAQWTSAAVLVAAAFHHLRSALERR